MAAIFGEGKKEIEANSCFAILGKNSKIKMAAIFGEGKKEIEANSCFAIFAKKKSKWPPFLGRGNFFENCKDYIS